MFRQAPLTATERGRRLFVPPAGFDALTRFAQHGYNVLVLAERGGGKTSSLRQLQLMLTEHIHADDPVAAFVDMRSAAQVADALSTLVRAGLAANGLPPDTTYSESSAPTQADALLAALGRLPRCRFLLDNVHPDSVGFPLFGVLRDRLWELDHQFVVAADAGDSGAFLRPPADAFWEQVVHLSISDEQAVALIRRRAPDEAEWAERLVSAVGAHPRRLIAAAQRIEAGQEEPPAVEDEYAQRRALLEQQSSMAQRLFQELEDLGPASPSDERLLRRVGASRPAIDRGLRELQEAGLARSYFRPDGPGRPRRVYELVA